jgi:hypothetical protein
MGMEDEKFLYFMERTEKDLEHIRTKVDALWDFKAMIIGGAAVVSIVCSALVSIAFIMFGVH